MIPGPDRLRNLETRGRESFRQSASAMSSYSRSYEIRWAALDPNWHLRHSAYAATRKLRTPPDDLLEPMRLLMEP